MIANTIPMDSAIMSGRLRYFRNPSFNRLMLRLKKGIEKIVALELTEAEKKNMKESADAVRDVNNLLNL